MSNPKRITDAETAYKLVTGDTGRLKAMRRLTYWHQDSEGDRCMLLDVIDTGTPELGVILYAKRYKFSEAENLKRTNAAGRKHNTYDGNNHHVEHYFFLEQSALNYPSDMPAMSLSIQCDHVLDYPLTAPEFHNDLASNTREVRIRPDLSRYEIE